MKRCKSLAVSAGLIPASLVRKTLSSITSKVSLSKSAVYHPIAPAVGDNANKIKLVVKSPATASINPIAAILGSVVNGVGFGGDRPKTILIISVSIKIITNNKL